MLLSVAQVDGGGDCFLIPRFLESSVGGRCGGSGGGTLMVLLTSIASQHRGAAQQSKAIAIIARVWIPVGHRSERQEEIRVSATMFLRRFARPLLASVKESTGLVGLDVVPNAREVLISLYQQTLKAVTPIPESAQYRKSVEALTHHRLKVCQEEEDWENIEKRIQGGQVEELIVQAKDELQLIPKMAEWKPWEVPEGYKVEVTVDDDSVPSHIPIHRQR